MKHQKSETFELKKEIASATKIALKCLEIKQASKIPEFGDISTIVIENNQDFSDDSFCDIETMMKSPVQKRDLNSFSKVSLKYGIKFSKAFRIFRPKPIKTDNFLCFKPSA